jgi:general secretion pathway protein M
MKRLSRRDRMALIVGLGALLLYAALEFIIFPLHEQNARLVKSIRSKEKALAEMQAMQGQYRKLATRGEDLRQQLTGRPANFTLFSFLEQKAAASQVKQNIAYMKPSQTLEEGALKQLLVEMKLQAISLQQLVSFLEQIESPENIVAVRRITIQENTQTAATLDVVMQVVSVERAAATLDS